MNVTFKHGSMYMARECTQIVQMFNDAGVNVKHFMITMTGHAINPNGDKWEDTVAVCEFDNQKFPRNDFTTSVRVFLLRNMIYLRKNFRGVST